MKYVTQESLTRDDSSQYLPENLAKRKYSPFSQEAAVVKQIQLCSEYNWINHSAAVVSSIYSKTVRLKIQMEIKISKYRVQNLKINSYRWFNR